MKESNHHSSIWSGIHRGIHHPCTRTWLCRCLLTPAATHSPHSSIEHMLTWVTDQSHGRLSITQPTAPVLLPYRMETRMAPVRSCQLSACTAELPKACQVNEPCRASLASSHAASSKSAAWLPQPHLIAVHVRSRGRPSRSPQRSRQKAEAQCATHAYAQSQRRARPVRPTEMAVSPQNWRFPVHWHSPWCSHMAHGAAMNAIAQAHGRLRCPTYLPCTTPHGDRHVGQSGV